MGWDFAQTSTLCLLLVCMVGVGLIWRISRPLTPLRCALIASIIIAIAGGSLLFGNFFMIEPLTPWMVVYLFSAGALALVLFALLYRRFDKSIEHEGRLAYVVKKAEVAYAQHRSRVSSRTRG